MTKEALYALGSTSPSASASSPSSLAYFLSPPRLRLGRARRRAAGGLGAPRQYRARALFLQRGAAEGTGSRFCLAVKLA